jgi:acetyl esterase/lipase
MARDKGQPKLRLQSLVYPVADYTLSAPSYEKFATGYGILTRDAMVWFQKHYLRSPADAEDWRASPIKAQGLPNGLAGVAPAIVVTAECDVLHDDGQNYAEALRRAGVPVEYREYPGMIHAFFGMGAGGRRGDERSARRRRRVQARFRLIRARSSSRRRPGPHSAEARAADGQSRPSDDKKGPGCPPPRTTHTPPHASRYPRCSSCSCRYRSPGLAARSSGCAASSSSGTAG